MASLKGKVAIVTGSSRGIGRAIVERFAQDEYGQAIYLQGGMGDALTGTVPLIPTSVPLLSRKSAEPSGLSSAFIEHLSQ